MTRAMILFFTSRIALPALVVVAVVFPTRVLPALVGVAVVFPVRIVVPALVLVAVDERSQREAADILGVSEKTVETRVYRARKTLRKKFDRN